MTAAVCPLADEHPLMLSCPCGYLSRSVRELIAEELNRWVLVLGDLSGEARTASALRLRAADLLGGAA